MDDDMDLNRERLAGWHDHLVELDGLQQALAQLLVGWLENEGVEPSPRLAVGVSIIQREIQRRLDLVMAALLESRDVLSGARQSSP